MGDLIFCLNATVPVFLLMIMGYIFRRIGLFNENFVKLMNKFVFVVALPVLVFKDLASQDFSRCWDGRFVLFCFIATVLSILIASLLSLLFHEKSIRGEFIQGSYRSSAALLGIALITNMYGNAGMAPLMILGAVPLYNIFAVVVLSMTSPENKEGLSKKLIIKTLAGIITNPIIIGIAAGMIWSILKIPQTSIMQKTVSSVAGIATPLGLMAMGGSFEVSRLKEVIRPAALATFMKLIGFAAIFLPVAVMLGFRKSELVAIMIMLGTCTTVSSFVMAKNMGHDGMLSAGTVMLTTFLSAFTLTGWLYILRINQLI